MKQTTDDFLKINPLGQLPVIEDSGVVIRDAQAILVHLATTYNNPKLSWYPIEQPMMAGQIQSWLAFADSITATCSAARLHDAMFFDIDIDRARKGGERLLRILDEHLWFQEQDNNDWICTTDNPSIADIACFPYVALCEEGGISQTPFPAIQRWLERFMRLEGFEPMAGMTPLKLPALNA